MYVNHLAALFLCLQAFCSCFEQAKYFDLEKKKRQLLNAVNAVQFFLILVIRSCCVISSERCVH